MTGRGGGSRGTGQTFPKQCSRPVRKPASLVKGILQWPSEQYSLLAPQPHQQMSPGLPSMELGGLRRTPHPSLSILCSSQLEHRPAPHTKLPLRLPPSQPHRPSLATVHLILHSIFPELASGCLGLILKSLCCHQSSWQGELRFGARTQCWAALSSWLFLLKRDSSSPPCLGLPALPSLDAREEDFSWG